MLPIILKVWLFKLATKAAEVIKHIKCKCSVICGATH